MTAARKPKTNAARKPKPTGETFDPPVALAQAEALYPTVMARLAE